MNTAASDKTAFHRALCLFVDRFLRMPAINYDRCTPAKRCGRESPPPFVFLNPISKTIRRVLLVSGNERKNAAELFTNISFHTPRETLSCSKFYDLNGFR